MPGVASKGFLAAAHRAFDEWIGDANHINSIRYDPQKVRKYCQWKANI